MGDGETTPTRIGGPAFEESAARLGLTRAQGLVVGGAGLVVGASAVAAPGPTIVSLLVLIQICFLVFAIWRLSLIVLTLSPRFGPADGDPEDWPRYTVLAALHDEAAVVGQLIRNLSALDYPADRLEILIVLEAHDAATLAAATAQARPDHLRIVVVPPGGPCTKPRALNHALQRAMGELVTIYDAEDAPDPGQLKAAARRFARDPRLACVQAPLRIRRHGASASPMMDRQFAIEYASLFEVTLPGLTRLGLPFPLGGTSNHIRMSALRAMGGWDPYNVTEDADLGFRLWRHDWTLAVIDSPTWETPPDGLDAWLPQRTRWLKGYMQTWGVHTRRPREMGWRGFLAMTMTVGLSLVSAMAMAPSMAWLAATVALAIAAGLPPDTPFVAMATMALGLTSAWASAALGARRAGVPYGAADMAYAPIYWSLLTLAFFHALWRLIAEPHVWNKTPHTAEAPRLDVA
jgi:cellulose synthase/poly-beta-1,6-N-acetylglucosamine synthase-like glycosyltransferase